MTAHRVAAAGRSGRAWRVAGAGVWCVAALLAMGVWIASAYWYVGYVWPHVRTVSVRSVWVGQGLISLDQRAYPYQGASSPSWFAYPSIPTQLGPARVWGLIALPSWSFRAVVKRLSLPTWLPAAVLLWVAIVKVRRLVRERSLVRRGCCTGCTYDLSGLSAQVVCCPECGVALDGARRVAIGVTQPALPAQR